MGLPFSFLLGLTAVFAAVELDPPIPGSGEAPTVARFAVLLLLPLALTCWAGRSVRARLATGRRGGVPSRAILRAAVLAVPLTLWTFVSTGGYADVALRLADGSETLRILALLLPLAFVEVPRIVAGTLVGQWCDIDDELRGRSLVEDRFVPSLAEVWPIVRLRLGWMLLLQLPCVLFGLALDAVGTLPALEGFLLGTGPGSTLALFAYLTGAAVVLPGWFRIAFGARPLPEPVGSRLREVAARLGFPPQRLFLLPTGQRALNAMMVGPLPAGRSLGLTDGLVRALDEDALAGVVAHEVGHAQRQHPALLACLAAVVPILLSSPLRVLDPSDWGTVPSTMFLGLLAALVLVLVRALAHRFEHEADVVSVQAFGAAPCAQALRTVLRLAVPQEPGWRSRVFSLHPDEKRRYDVMWAYERDPAFRARFDAAGRRLRVGVLGAVAVALVAAVAAWSVEWPFERAFWAFHRGDLVATRAAMAEVGETVPARWRQSWRQLGEELDAASRLAPDARDWRAAEPAIREHAWSRGAETLLARGPAAARPWFALAVAFAARPSVVDRAVHEFCRAAAATDLDRMERARLVVRRLGTPPELQRAFAE